MSDDRDLLRDGRVRIVDDHQRAALRERARRDKEFRAWFATVEPEYVCEYRATSVMDQLDAEADAAGEESQDPGDWR